MLSQERLSAKILDIVKSNPGGDDAMKYFADNLAKAVIEEVQLATVTISSGILVQVAYPAGTGTTTAPGTGSLS